MTTSGGRRFSRLSILLAVVFLAVLPATPVRAEPEDGEPGGAEGREVRFAGMVISVDPESGRLRAPDAEQVQKLRAAMREMFAEVRASRRAGPRVRPDGPRTLPAEGERIPREDGLLSALVGTDHLNYTVASVGTDRALSTHCLNGVHDEAEAAEPPAVEE